MINADLDAKRHDQCNIRTRRTNLQLSIQREEAGSSKSIVKVAEEKEENENLPKTDPEDTEQMRAFNKIVAFFDLCGQAFGMKIGFLPTWKKSFRYYFAVAYLCLVYTCLIYTAQLHYANGDIVRILEPLSSAGISISVS